MAMSNSSQLLVEAHHHLQSKNVVKACPSSSLLSGFSSRVGYSLSPSHALFSSSNSWVIKTHAQPPNSSSNIEKKMAITADKPFFNNGIDYYARKEEEEEDDDEYEGGRCGIPTWRAAEQAGGEMGGIREWISDLCREERESQSAADNLQWLEERVMEGDQGRSAEDYSRRAGVFGESAKFFIERKRKCDRVALELQRLQDVVMKEDRGKSPQDYNARADIFSKSAEILVSANST